MNIIGRLTRDAEVRTLSNKKQVVNFSIATNDNYRKKQGERIEQTTFFDCSYWISSKVAELLKKGTLVELIGFHPEWQRKFFKTTIEFLSNLFSEYNIQIIFTSNTPFITSDLLKSNIIFISEETNGKSEFLCKKNT